MKKVQTATRHNVGQEKFILQLCVVSRLRSLIGALICQGSIVVVGLHWGEP